MNWTWRRLDDERALGPGTMLPSPSIQSIPFRTGTGYDITCTCGLNMSAGRGPQSESSLPWPAMPPSPLLHSARASTATRPPQMASRAPRYSSSGSAGPFPLFPRPLVTEYQLEREKHPSNRSSSTISPQIRRSISKRPCA